MSTELTGYRRALGEFIESARVTNAILALILLNGVVLGLQTSRTLEAHIGGLLEALNTVVLAVFVVELTIKFIAFRWAFFRSGWNIFDFVIVGISLVPASDGLEVLRTLRVLRLLRLVSQIPKLREIVESIGRSLSGLMWTAALLAMVFYIFGVMGTLLFRDLAPQHFGTLGRTTYSLFQVMTLDNWSLIARPLMELQPWAWLYFIPFILTATFMVLNLFIAVIVNATNSLSRDADAERQEALLAEVRQLGEQVAALHTRLDNRQPDPAASQTAPAQTAASPAAPSASSTDPAASDPST